MQLSHNARIKRYPDGSGELLIGSRPFGGGSVSRLPAYLDDGNPRFLHFESPEERAERLYGEMEQDAIALGDAADNQGANAAACRAASIQRSVRRARKAVVDLARSNEWAYFVTLTLSPDRVDRYDFSAIWRHLRHWLDNCVRRKGLAYILVPEHHKDGAIHFHGFFNDALEATDSGTMSIPGRKAPVRVRSEAQRAAFERMGGHAVEWFDVDVRDWEGVPGWYQPRDFPYASFLTLRVTAEGEILPPYLKDSVSQTDVLRETDAEHGSGGDRPPEEEVTTATGPTSDHDAGQSVDCRARGVSGAVRSGDHSTLATSRPARIPPHFPHLTISGLSNPGAPPAPQAPRGCGP